jgi:hypothetical protein
MGRIGPIPVIRYLHCHRRKSSQGFHVYFLVWPPL